MKAAERNVDSLPLFNFFRKMVRDVGLEPTRLGDGT